MNDTAKLERIYTLLENLESKIHKCRIILRGADID